MKKKKKVPYGKSEDHKSVFSENNRDGVFLKGESDQGESQDKGQI